MGEWSFTFLEVIVSKVNNRTRRTDSIAGDIWQAGGESDALILGVSFDSTRQVLLNTLHVAISLLVEEESCP